MRTELLAASLALALAGQAAAQTRDIVPVAPVALASFDAPTQLRIIGGKPATEGAWPSMVALVRLLPDGRAAQVCGGTVIAPDWVLTAAHCISTPRGQGIVEADVMPAQQFAVFEGAQVLDASKGRFVRVAEIRMHPAYRSVNGGAALNDLALLRLAEPSNQPAQVLLAPAHRASHAGDGKPATAIGYGRTSTTQQGGSDRLLQADVSVFPKDRCRTNYGQGMPAPLTQAMFSDITICAGDPAGGRDVCNGDSGGPLFVRGPGGAPTQVGVVSWGRIPCAQAGFPGVFAAVPQFRDWIAGHVPEAAFSDATQGGPGPAVDTVVKPEAEAGPPVSPGTAAQVALDIGPGTRIPIGTEVRLSVLSSVPGQLVVVNINARGQTFQVFPNQYSGGDASGVIEAGRKILVPAEGAAFRLRVGEPPGRNRVVALVLPRSQKVSDLLAGHLDLQPIENGEAYLATLAQALADSRTLMVEPVNRAMAEREFEVLPRAN